MSDPDVRSGRFIGTFSRREVVKMAIEKWRPFRGLWNIHDEIDRMFEDFFGRAVSPERALRERTTELAHWTPDLDLAETDNEYIVKADLPGLKQDEIKISIRDDVLTIKGERKSEKEEKGKNYHRVERSYGAFARSIELPAKVQGDKIKASYKEGVLEIVLPKSEEAKPKEISIEVNK